MNLRFGPHKIARYVDGNVVEEMEGRWNYPTKIIRKQTISWLGEEDADCENRVANEFLPTQIGFNRMVRWHGENVVIPITKAFPHGSKLVYPTWDAWERHYNGTYEFIHTILDALIHNNVVHVFFTGEEGSGKSLFILSLAHICMKIFKLLSEDDALLQRFIEQEEACIPELLELQRDVEAKHGITEKLLALSPNKFKKAYRNAPPQAIIVWDENIRAIGPGSRTDMSEIDSLEEGTRFEQKFVFQCGVRDHPTPRTKWKGRSDMNNWFWRIKRPGQIYTPEEFTDFLLEWRPALTRFFLYTYVMVGLEPVANPYKFIILPLTEDREIIDLYNRFKNASQMEYDEGTLSTRNLREYVQDIVGDPEFETMCFKPPVTKKGITTRGFDPSGTATLIRDKLSLMGTDIRDLTNMVRAYCTKNNLMNMPPTPPPPPVRIGKKKAETTVISDRIELVGL